MSYLCLMICSRSNHRKCDEQFPGCGRCVRIGKTCITPQSIVPGFSPLSFANQGDRTSWEFFWNRSVFKLTGHYFHDFWLEYIPHMAQQSECIRFALLALASLEMSWTKTDVDAAHTRLVALAQYQKAIKVLLNQQDPLTVTLVASILFSQFHFVQRHNYCYGVQHLRSGVKILTSTASMPQTDQDIVRTHLQPFFQNFVTGILGPMEFDPHFRRTDLLADDLDGRFDIVERFTSLGQARCQMQETMDDIFDMLEAPQIHSDRTYFLQLVHKGKAFLLSWYRKLLCYLNCIARSQVSSFRRDASLLRLQYHVCSITLAVQTFLNRDLAYDKHLTSFREIVQLCHRMMTTDGGARMLFGHGMTPALDLVASKCRHPDIRRQAITLIDRYSSVDGLVRSHPILSIWHMTLWIEEGGRSARNKYTKVTSNDLCRTIVPAENRIEVTLAVFHPGRRQTSSSESSIPPHWQLHWRHIGESHTQKSHSASFPVTTLPSSIWTSSCGAQTCQKCLPSPHHEPPETMMTYEFRNGLKAKRHKMRLPLILQTPATGVMEPMWTVGAEVRVVCPQEVTWD